MENAAIRSHKLGNKNPSVRSGIHPFELLVKETTKSSRKIQVIAIALGCSSELGDKTLFSNTPHTFVSDYREIKLKLNGS